MIATFKQARGSRDNEVVLARKEQQLDCQLARQARSRDFQRATSLDWSEVSQSDGLRRDFGRTLPFKQLRNILVLSRCSDGGAMATVLILLEILESIHMFELPLSLQI